MSTDAALPMSQIQPEQAGREPAKFPRVWPAIVLVGLYWLCGPVLYWLEIPGFVLWLTIMGALAALTLLFVVWWLNNRRIRGMDRLWGLAVAVGAGVVCA